MAFDILRISDANFLVVVFQVYSDTISHENSLLSL